MPTRTVSASGGTRAWSDPLTWDEGQVPTAADDVVATAASGNVTMTAATFSRSFDGLNWLGTLTRNAGGWNWNIGDATAGAGNIALRFGAGMTYVPGAGAGIVFASTSATQQTIDTAGKSLGVGAFSLAGSYVLAGDLTMTASFTWTSGVFATANFAISCSSFNSPNPNVRSLFLGSSTITVAGGWTFNGSNLTVAANTATLVMTTLGPTFNGGGVDYAGLSISATGMSLASTPLSILGGATLKDVSVTAYAVKGQSLVLSSASTTVITGTLTVNRSSAITRLTICSSTTGIPATLSLNAYSLSSVNFRDITAAGAANWDVSGITGGSGDEGGNSGITFTASTVQTWNGTGNWDTVARWTSRVPLPQDDVIVDAGATGTVTFNMSYMGRNVDFTGCIRSVDGSATTGNAFFITGSLTLGSGMTLTSWQSFMLAGRSSHTIRTNGKTLTSSLLTVGVVSTATYALLDALTLNNAGGTLAIVCTLVTNDFALTHIGVSSGVTVTTGRILGGTSTITLQHTGTGGMTVWSHASLAASDLGTTTIVIANANVGTRTFVGGGQTYGTLQYNVASTGTLIVSGANVFDHWAFAGGRIIQLTSGVVQTLLNQGAQAQGTAGSLLTIRSVTAGQRATLLKPIVGGVDPAPAFQGDYLDLKDLAATGDGTWRAGSHSVDSGNNTGWIFADGAGWSTTTVETLATGTGSKAGQGGVNAVITTPGSGSGFKSSQGGSELELLLVSQAEGFKGGQGGSRLELLLVDQAEGFKGGEGASQAVVTLYPIQEGFKAAEGGVDAELLVVALGLGLLQDRDDSTGVPYFVERIGAVLRSEDD